MKVFDDPRTKLGNLIRGLLRIRHRRGPSTAPIGALSAQLLSCLKSGQTFPNAEALRVGDELAAALARALDVHAHHFSARRAHDFLNPILSRVAPADTADARSTNRCTASN